MRIRETLERTRDRERDGFVVVDRDGPRRAGRLYDGARRGGFEPLMSGARSPGDSRLRAYEYMRGKRREVSRERVREESRDRSRSQRRVRFVE